MRNRIISRFISLPIIFIVLFTMIPLTRVAAVGDHLDDTFDGNGKLSTDFAGANDIGYDVAIQADGKIVALGSTGQDMALTRYNPNGSLDTTFSGDGRVTGPIGAGLAVLIQPDGKIVVAGYTSEQLASQQFVVARFLTNGNPDNTFNGNGQAAVAFPAGGINVAVAQSISIQSNGYLVLAGYRLTSDTTNTYQDWAIARFSPTGLLDPGFSDDGKTTVNFGNVPGLESASTLNVMPDGKILVGGTANIASNTSFGFARLNTDGTPDLTFDMDGKISTDFGANEILYDMKVLPDAKIVACGSSGEHFAVARFNANGTPDTSFDLDGIVVTNINPGGTDIPEGIVIQNDGKIVLAGTKVTGSNPGDFLLARYMPNGALDPAFGVLGILTTDLNANSDDEGADIILQPDGKYVVVGATKNTGADHNNIALARYLPNFGDAPFDFDGDAKTDIGIFRPSAGEWWYRRSGDGQVPAFQFGVGTDKIVPADYTGDGKADIAFWRPSTGEWYILRSENLSFFSFPFGSNGDIPAPADFDEDGKADPAVFRPSNGTWYIQRSGDQGTTIVQFGTNGDLPVQADYDGDGKADPAIYRPSVGQWWLLRSTAGTRAFSFGTSTDKPVQGDYTGDGIADVAFWRPSTGFWYVLRSENSSFYSVPFGVTPDVATPGDYDGDGKIDTAVFRPSSGEWFIQRSSGGTTIVGFGNGTDRPIPNAFVP